MTMTSLWHLAFFFPLIHGSQSLSFVVPGSVQCGRDQLNFTVQPDRRLNPLWSTAGPAFGHVTVYKTDGVSSCSASLTSAPAGAGAVFSVAYAPCNVTFFRVGGDDAQYVQTHQTFHIRATVPRATDQSPNVYHFPIDCLIPTSWTVGTNLTNTGGGHGGGSGSNTKAAEDIYFKLHPRGDTSKSSNGAEVADGTPLTLDMGLIENQTYFVSSVPTSCYFWDGQSAGSRVFFIQDGKPLASMVKSFGYLKDLVREEVPIGARHHGVRYNYRVDFDAFRLGDAKPTQEVVSMLLPRLAKVFEIICGHFETPLVISCDIRVCHINASACNTWLNATNPHYQPHNFRVLRLAASLDPDSSAPKRASVTIAATEGGFFDSPALLAASVAVAVVAAGGLCAGLACLLCLCAGGSCCGVACCGGAGKERRRRCSETSSEASGDWDRFSRRLRRF